MPDKVIKAIQKRVEEKIEKMRKDFKRRISELEKEAEEIIKQKKEEKKKEVEGKVKEKLGEFRQKLELEYKFSIEKEKKILRNKVYQEISKILEGLSEEELEKIFKGVIQSLPSSGELEVSPKISGLISRLIKDENIKIHPTLNKFGIKFKSENLDISYTIDDILAQNKEKIDEMIGEITR